MHACACEVMPPNIDLTAKDCARSQLEWSSRRHSGQGLESNEISLPQHDQPRLAEKFLYLGHKTKEIAVIDGFTTYSPVLLQPICQATLRQHHGN